MCLQRKLPIVKLQLLIVNDKRVQISAFHSMADLHIRDKVRSIIKGKVDSENTTQDEEELLPGNNFYVSLLCFFSFYKGQWFQVY